MSGEVILQMIFALVGGLGIFLLGMRYMQEGLQVVAGPRIRKMINAVTGNRFLAIGIGVFVTTLVQSSSVTSVMVIGLVNSELMALSGAVGVIMGANIGTTITGWMLALKIGKYGLPIIGVCAFGWLFLKKEKYRYVALAILGIGMVFFGLELMKNGFKPLRGHPEFTTWFQMFEATDYLGVIKAALVGCLLTVVVQSSSATLGITIALANTGVIEFQTAAALVLGENIGTTITAYLASLGAEDIDAKRAAYFHILFNVLGVAWITALFHPFYLPFIKNFVIGTNPDLMNGDSYPYMTSAIAAAHSGFNIANTILFIPLVKPITRFLEKYVTGGKKGAKAYLTHLDFEVTSSPLTAIEQSTSEIKRMDNHVKEMLGNLRTIIGSTGGKETSALEEKVFEREEILDKVQIEITTFLTRLLARPLSLENAEEARAQLRLADEYESVSDYVTTVLKVHSRLKENDAPLTEQQQKVVLELHDRVDQYYETVHAGFQTSNLKEYLIKVRRDSRKITDEIRELRSLHWQRLSEQAIEPLVSTSYMDIVMAYRKIKDHLLNIAEAIEGGKIADPE